MKWICCISTIDLTDNVTERTVEFWHRIGAVANSLSHAKLLLFTAAAQLLILMAITVLDANTELFLWLQQWGVRLPEAFWASVTLLGDSLTLCVLLLLFARKYPNMVWSAVLAALLTTVIVQSLKHSLVLPRPPLIVPPEQLTLIGPEYRHASFPSGHSTAIWLFVSVWLFSAYHWAKVVVLMSLATLVCLSRVMVGVHWPVDITAGALIGWVGGWAGLWLSQRWRWGMTLTGQRIIVAALLLAAIALVGYDSGYTQAGPLVNVIAISGLVFGGYHLFVLVRHPQRIQSLDTRDHG